MRVVSALAAIGLALFSVVAAHAADWQLFQPAGGGFAIEMPGKPQLKSENRNGHKLDTALFAIDKAAAGADLVFMVKYQARSEPPGDDAPQILDNVVKAMAEGNKLISVDKNDIGDFPAREFVMQDKDDTYQVRAVITDKYFIEVMFIGPADNALGKHFLDSFSAGN